MTTSSWIVATGVIRTDTPDEFRRFLTHHGGATGQIVLHSPGGTLSAGLELGRIIRSYGLTSHIGQTYRSFENNGSPCSDWSDQVYAGICVSSCAYAFLGGEVRFVESPYYPTEGNILGFHQFFDVRRSEAELITPEQAASIRTSAFSVAQVLTGQIVTYAIEMGIDPRVVAFAASTPSDDLYFPTAAELSEMRIASGLGLGSWFMEPYNNGLITVVRPRRSDSMLAQITMLCLSDRRPSMLVTMAAQASYRNPDSLPLDAVTLEIDGRSFAIPRDQLTIRFGDGVILIRVPMDGLTQFISTAHRIEFSLDAARSMGGFREASDLDETARRSIALAWRNCI